MAEEKFTVMLEAMPKIADAVKGLPAELQPVAFNELVAALKGTEPVPAARKPADEPAVEVDGQNEPPAATNGTNGRGNARATAARAARATKQVAPERAH